MNSSTAGANKEVVEELH